MKKTFEDLEREFAAAAREANELKAERDELKAALAKAVERAIKAENTLEASGRALELERNRVEAVEAENRTLWQVIELMTGGERK